MTNTVHTSMSPQEPSHKRGHGSTRLKKLKSQATINISKVCFVFIIFHREMIFYVDFSL